MHPLLESLFAFLFKYRPLVYRQGELTFAVPRATATVIAVALVAALVLSLSTRYRLRVVVFALLGFCLMRPSLSVPALLEQRGYVAVLVDRSHSMSVRDEDGVTRAQAASSLTDASSNLRRQLEQKFRVRYFDFGGDGTDIGGALQRASSDLSGLPVAGFVVVSDGADNAQREWAESLLPLRSARVPVFTVGLGRESGEKDVRLTRVSIPSSVLKGATVIADVQIEHRGMSGTAVTVEIEDAGRILARQTVQLQRGVDVTHASLSFPASESGARRLRARVAPVNGEKQVQNNERQALISVRDNREKILLVDGEPRFEDKFIRRALTGENNLQLVQLLRTAPKKYYRLDVDSAGELANGFPTSRAELFKYRALILGSVEASFFTHDQLQMLADFVSVRGGSLLALGGPKALAEGGWSGTAVADALPIEIERGPAARFSLVRVFPTAAGATHPVTQLDSTTTASLEHWGRLPPLSVTNIVGALKPGATALLADSVNTPVLAYHRFGRGAAFVFTPQDSWLWQMHKDISVEDQTHEIFWRQLLRYLVQDSNDRVQLVASQSARVQQAMSLTAAVTDTAFQSLNDAQVTATVRAPDGTSHIVPLSSAGQNFEGSFTPTLPGVHEVAIEAKRGDAVIGETLAYINAGTEDLELFDPVARPSTLKRIADETGGRFYTPNKAGSIAEDISLLGHGITVQQQKELWDMPAVFLVMLIALCAEWLYRRKQGLA